jgi:hypothetical protein
MHYVAWLGLWVKVKCLHREEFVVVGWTDPEGSRPWLGALLLAYYDPEGRLVYAGRAGVGISNAELERLWHRLQPLATSEMPLDVPPPRTSRFGSPLVLSRVHWVRPELVAEVKYLNWTDDNLLRQVIYQGRREDKEPSEVRRHPCRTNRRRLPRSKLPARDDLDGNGQQSEASELIPAPAQRYPAATRKHLSSHCRPTLPRTKTRGSFRHISTTPCRSRFPQSLGIALALIS